MMDTRSLKNRDDYKDYMDTTPQLFCGFLKNRQKKAPTGGAF